MMFKKKVHILGTEWKIKVLTEKKDDSLANCAGYCNPFSKKIVIRDYRKDEDWKEVAEAVMLTTLRHEMIHAYLYESGLYTSSSTTERWAMNEEMVDYLAIQWEKINASLRECGTI